MQALSSAPSLSSFESHAAIMLCVCFVLGLRQQVNGILFGFKAIESHAILTGTLPS